MHTYWLCLNPRPGVSPTLTALVGWRSWPSLTLTQLVHNWSKMMLPRCSSSHNSLTGVPSYVASVQNFCCHWKLPVIHKDCILLNSRNGIIFHLNLIIEIIKEWTDKYFRNVWMTLIILVTKHKRNRNSNLEPLRYNSMFTFLLIIPILLSGYYTSSLYVIHFWSIWRYFEIAHHLNYWNSAAFTCNTIPGLFRRN